jgi:hypothetical protein
MLMMLGTGAGSRRTKNGTSAMQKSASTNEKNLRANESSMRAADGNARIGFALNSQSYEFLATTNMRRVRKHR